MRIALSTAIATTLFCAAGVATASDFKLHTGVYKCELNQSLTVKSAAADHSSVVIRWGKKDYTLKAQQTNSGALRFEDAKNKLAWVVLVGNSMFLDTKKGQRLANACVATAA
jgi:membrane-bound inhibitor of C-type lysozyme